MLHTAGQSIREQNNALEFMWLELTNRCNLQCTHCYAESGPYENLGILTLDNYKALIDEASDLGCKKVQFIGGEPTLSPHLIPLIQHARNRDFKYIEVFTNLTRMSPGLVRVFKEYTVCVATSVYAAEERVHDHITQVHGSFTKTISAIQLLLEHEIQVRAGIIEMEENSGLVDETYYFLKGMGIESVGYDRIRGFGRGATGDKNASLSELCGSCANNTLCVSAEGEMSPCIMSKQWQIGTLKDMSLEDAVHSPTLANLRKEIDVATTATHNQYKSMNCAPYCSPHCQPTCAPQCSPTCNPIDCGPRGCWPAMCTPHD